MYATNAADLVLHVTTEDNGTFPVRDAVIHGPFHDWAGIRGTEGGRAVSCAMRIVDCCAVENNKQRRVPEWGVSGCKTGLAIG